MMLRTLAALLITLFGCSRPTPKPVDLSQLEELMTTEGFPIKYNTEFKYHLLFVYTNEMGRRTTSTIPIEYCPFTGQKLEGHELNESVLEVARRRVEMSLVRGRRHILEHGSWPAR